MNTTSQKVLVIMGPTASGKSAAAISLAKKFNGEVISADSRQIYRGLNIGSGKVPRDLQIESQKFSSRRQADASASLGGSSIASDKNNYISEGVVHHLIDVAEPNEDFNISHFKTLTNKAIKDILSRGKLPIICGGTGFWIDAITNNTMLPEVAPNEELRNMLRNKTAEELFAMLLKLDPERAETIDKQNPVRLIRAIEICEALGAVPKPTAHSLKPGRYNFLQIGINVPREILNEKIKKRLNERFEQGMIEEVENLNNLPAGERVSWEHLEALGLEYRWIARFLQDKITSEVMHEKLYFDIIHYAKRQMTWFKRNKKIVWCEDYVQIEKEVKKFLK